MDARLMAELTGRVLDHYAHELQTASDEKFDRLAQEAESLPKSPLGHFMRQLVDLERAVRIVLREASR